MKRSTSNDEFLRKRAERQRKIRKRRLKLFFFFFTIFLLALSAVLCLTVFFPIAQLNTKGSSLYNSKQILEASDISVGDNLFAISEGTVLKKLKQKLPYIETLELKRQLPDTLTLVVKEAEEYACYFDGKAYYTLSKSNWVMKKMYDSPENLFTVKGVKLKCKVGSEAEFTDSKLKELSESLIASLKAEKLNVNSIDVGNTIAITVNVENRFEVNLGNANFIPEKIKHLASMIENISPEKSGKINLSMWTNDNTQGTFVEQINE